MFLDERLFKETVDQFKKIKKRDDLIDLFYHLLGISIEKEGGTLLFTEEEVKIEVSVISKKRIENSWLLYLSKLEKESKALADLYREYFNHHFK